MLRTFFCLFLGAMCLTSLTLSQGSGERQYYSAWTKHSTKNYYYRNYYYKKAENDSTYTYHYGIYYPSRGKKVYMYNPHSRKYWGMWSGEKYSVLPKDKQKGSLDDIVAEDFPPPALPPNIPGIDEKILMIAPPNDFPKLEDDRP